MTPLRLLTCVSLAVFLVSFERAAIGQDFGFDILGLQNEDFFKPATVGIINISPSGARVAYSRIGYDSERIHVLDTTTSKDKPLSAPSRSTSFSYLAWLDDQHILLQNQDGDLFRHDTESDMSIRLFDAQRMVVLRNAIIYSNFTLPRVLSLLPQDPEHILISAYAHDGKRVVYRLPLREWDDEKLPEPLLKNPKGFDLWHADLNGQVRLAMKIKERSTEIFHLEPNSSRWRSFGSLIASTENSIDLNLAKHSATERRDYLLGFDFDPRRFYFASNKHTNTTAIYLYDLEEQRVVEQVAHDPSYDIADLNSGAAIAMTSQSKRKWVGFHYQGDRPRTVWIDETYQQLQANVDALLPGSSNLVVDWNDDETLFIVSANWSERPGALFLYRPSDNTLTAIGADDHPLAKSPGSPTEVVKIQAEAGHAIEGYFTPAQDAGSEPAPLVMLIHGGPWARDTFTYDPFVQCLAHNGFSTLRINFRGSTGYGYEHFIGAAQNYGWGVQEDILSARRWAVENGYASPDKIAIMGFSFGGYAAALASASQADAFRCAVPISGIYDLVYETKAIKNQVGNSLAYEYWKRMVGSDWKDRKRLADISPVNLADKIEIPLLIAHGTLDPVAHIDHARRFVKALEKAGARYDFIELAEEAHSLDLPKNQAYLFDRIARFLEQNLSD